MSKKYNPKQTRENIVSTAVQLFMEKGFEKTSMQDIANAIGISKGGIYHHFKSKKEIINTVRENKANSVAENIDKWMSTIEAESERDMLTAILEENVTNQKAHALDDVFSTQIKSADFIVSIMTDSVNSSAPVFADIMKKGVEDGSITTNYPDECAEVFFLLVNTWCDPVIFEADEKKLYKRLKFVQEMMRQLGADIVSDEVVNQAMILLGNLYSEKDDVNE